jgi:hypothetical protein
MSKRAEALAARVEQGARELIAFAEKLSEAEWQTVCVDDKRSVAVLVHHVAIAYPAEVDITRALAAGKPISGVTWEMVNELNDQHATDNAGVDKQEALSLLRKNSALAAQAIRELSDEQLDSVAPLSLNWDVPLTAQYFIEEHPITHPFRHLASMRAALTAKR